MFNYFIVLKYDKIIINELQDITKFNISVRYDDYKKTFYKKCTDKFTEKNKKIKVSDLFIPFTVCLTPDISIVGFYFP